MKVYVATSGPPGEYGYEIVGVFTDKADAAAFELGDRVVEFPLREGPAEVRDRHVVEWFDAVDRAPKRSSYRAVFDDAPDREVDHGWRTVFETWDDSRASAKTAALDAAHIARAERHVAALERIDVMVWYEPGDGRALLFTPLHAAENALPVSRETITAQAGLPEDATLHGRWFSVQMLRLDHADGFAVCTDPDHGALAGARLVIEALSNP